MAVNTVGNVLKLHHMMLPTKNYAWARKKLRSSMATSSLTVQKIDIREDGMHKRAPTVLFDHFRCLKHKVN